MNRAIAFALICAALVPLSAAADPAIQVRTELGATIITLEGDYANQWYSVSRAETRTGFFAPLMDSNVLCMGSCSVTDETAVPGRVYYYRFDLQLADGTFTSYGPYEILAEASRRIAVAVMPQPVRGPARVEVRLAGVAGQGAVEVRARLFDLQGRPVRTLHTGLMPRGRNVISWDGTADGGRALAAGVYLLRVESPLGTAIQRVVRTR